MWLQKLKQQFLGFLRIFWWRTLGTGRCDCGKHCAKIVDKIKLLNYAYFTQLQQTKATYNITTTNKVNTNNVIPLILGDEKKEDKHYIPNNQPYITLLWKFQKLKRMGR